MCRALRKLLFTGLCLLPWLLAAQSTSCSGPTFVQIIQDEDGRDVRLTAVAPYPGGDGDLLLGGAVGGDFWLLRTGRDGEERWRRSFPTNSESTELSIVNGLLVDRQGFVAGVGSTFNDNRERGFLFRYDPRADRLLYLRQPTLQTEFSGLLEIEAGYLITGSRRGGLAPEFSSAFRQLVLPETGLPAGPGRLFDLRGEESFLDAKPLPGGDVLAVGVYTLRGGAGQNRIGITRLDAAGDPVYAWAGPVTEDQRGRLLASDVAVRGSAAYVLHWGNIGPITGGLETTFQLSRHDLATGQHQVTWDYDMPDFNGEQGAELVPYRDGWLVYGYSLIGRRYPWLMHLDGNGEVRWARAYELPGDANVYLRANQQVLADDAGITLVANYSFAGQRPRRGALLRLDADGNVRDGCLTVRNITVNRIPDYPADWSVVTPRTRDTLLEWPEALPPLEEPPLTKTDDCDQDCRRCAGRSFRRQAVCRGDSLFIAGAWRQTAGVFTETVTATDGSCDSLRLTELAISDGVVADYVVERSCGLARARVQLRLGGGERPYQTRWSEPGAAGVTADLLAGDYTVTVTDALGCNPTVVAVTVPPATAVPLDFVAEPPACPGDSTGTIRLTPAGRGSLRVVFTTGRSGAAGPFVPDALTGLPPGDYGVVIQDSTGCEVFRQVGLPAATPVGVRVAGDRRVRLGDEATLIAQSTTSTTFADYAWTATDSLGCADCPLARLRPRAGQLVNLTAVTAAGCVARDSFRLAVIGGEPRLYVPTAFSPNGDGLNDVWRPEGGPEIEAVLECRVYDRWGRLSWELTQPGRWWEGQDEPPGVYVYELTARLIDNTIVRRSGQITLLR